MAKFNRKTAKRKPISSHPLFPWMVALWCGALLGLASLAVRPSLVETLVLNSGIGQVIPAAAPPLGLTARLLIALTLATGGALTGGLLARLLTRPKGEARVGAHDIAMTDEQEIEVPLRRPISAHDELGGSLDAPAEPANPLLVRKHALTAEPEEHPLAPREDASLPDGQPTGVSRHHAGPEPLDLRALAAPAGLTPSIDGIMTDQHQAAPLAPSPTAELPSPTELGMIDLALRLQQSMARRRAARQNSEITADMAQTDTRSESGAEASLSAPQLGSADACDAIGSAASESEGEDPGPAENAFGSLLSINSAANPAPMRHGFGRRAEPETAGAAIEPVVIFPGQALALPVVQAPDQQASSRQCDIASAAASNAPPTIDPDEAEAALRAALANLQRLSGAA